MQDSQVKKLERLGELDVMKVIGILLVVFAHTSRMYTPDGLIPTNQTSDILSAMTRAIYGFHMPLFVFISGLTYRHTSNKPSYRSFANFVTNKAKRLIIPYIIFGVFWVMPFMFLLGFQHSLKLFLINGLVFSLGCRHLWYVWMLFNVFVLMWGLEKIAQRFSIPPTFLLLIGIISLYLSNQDWVPVIFQIRNTLKYLPYFILGYVTHGHTKSYFYVITPLLATGYIFQEYIDSISSSTLYAICGVSISYALAIITKNASKHHTARLISRNSFGIYLFHPMLIYLVFYYTVSSSLSPLLLCGIVFVFSFLVSFALTELTRKVHLQIIIGEKWEKTLTTKG